jgi:hypothetical protein
LTIFPLGGAYAVCQFVLVLEYFPEFSFLHVSGSVSKKISFLAAFGGMKQSNNVFEAYAHCC